MTKFLNISTDNTLGGVSPSDSTVSSQKAVKDYIDAQVGPSGVYHPDLFDWKWADHQLNDVQWLRGDTFSWQDGTVYAAAYQHLIADLQRTAANLYCWGDIYFCESSTPSINDPVYSLASGVYHPIGYVTAYTNNTLSIWIYGGQPVANAARVSANDVTNVTIVIASQTETINGITIAYTQAVDGHKICGSSQETALAALYNSTGVAWYYILDPVNQRFKLPRTRFGVVGLHDRVGNFVPESLPNITGTVGSDQGIWRYQDAYVESGSLYVSATANTGNSGTVHGIKTISIDASRSSPTYQNDAPVQQNATQMYLYFYVGSFSQTAIENTAGLNAELFNGKADTNLLNTPMATADYVVA